MFGCSSLGLESLQTSRTRGVDGGRVNLPRVEREQPGDSLQIQDYRAIIYTLINTFITGSEGAITKLKFSALEFVSGTEDQEGDAERGALALQPLPSKGTPAPAAVSKPPLGFVAALVWASP